MEHISLKQDGHVLIITLNRAAKYNALSLAMYVEIGQALARLNRDPELRVAVLCAEGKHFTAGVDLDQWAPLFSSGQGLPEIPGGIDPFGIGGERHAKPVVIAVQGYCFTWGVEILLNTEIRIAASDTQFQMLEVQRGFYPCGGATLRLPREIGWGNAHKVLLTGERWSAEDALRWGLVQDVVAPGEQVSAAMNYAHKIADCAPLGVQGALRSTRTAQTAAHDTAVSEMYEHLIPVMASEDAAEGVRSFIERRKAVFTGS